MAKQRLTFAQVQKECKAFGVNIERRGKGFDYWYASDHSAVGYAPTLSEAYADLQSSFFKI